MHFAPTRLGRGLLCSPRFRIRFMVPRFRRAVRFAAEVGVVDRHCFKMGARGENMDQSGIRAARASGAVSPWSGEATRLESACAAPDFMDEPIAFSHVMSTAGDGKHLIDLNDPVFRY